MSIPDPNHRLPGFQSYIILRDPGLTKLLVEIQALLDDVPYSCITKEKEPIIFNQNGSFSCQKIKVYLVILASVALLHLWEKTLQKQGIRWILEQRLHIGNLHAHWQLHVILRPVDLLLPGPHTFGMHFHIGGFEVEQSSDQFACAGFRGREKEA